VADDPKPKSNPDRGRHFKASMTRLGKRWSPDPSKPKPKPAKKRPTEPGD
jgi:hypothetical protein